MPCALLRRLPALNLAAKDRGEARMVKTMVLMARRTDLTHAEFRDYYERNHTVLGMRYFEFRKYIRNYVIAPGGEPVAFDVFSEFWQDSLPEVYAAMAGPVGDLMREDGNRFID